MKKNTMMRLASGLLVAVLLSTCAISGTFAKYVTSDNGSDSARVAKWGVVVAAKDFDMFKADYDTTDTTLFSGSSSVSAAADDRDDVLAPGTSGSFADISITGTPEVAVNVVITPTVTVSDNWTVDGAFYCPVIITVGGTKFCGLDYGSAASFADAIAANIAGKSAVYGPNTNLANYYNNTNLDISWEWAFTNVEHSTAHNTCTGLQTDVKDTALGDAAVSADLTISIGIEISVTQVD